ncbi:MAG: hypothetical protein AB7L17_10695 [Ilumatobacteraceae bacterium]
MFIERRRPQIRLNRVSGSGVSRSIARLVGDKWLEIAKHAGAESAHEYVLGERFRRDGALTAAWTELSRRIHGKRGLMESLGDVPLVAHKKPNQLAAIGESRALVLAALVTARNIPTASELINFLSPLMSESTVQNSVRSLTALQLVEVGTLQPANDWREVLQTHLSTSGAIEQRDRVVRQVAVEQAEWCRTLSRREQFAEIVARRGSARCVFCGRQASEVEHYPPQSWMKFRPEVSDHPEFTWVACTRCNRLWGAWVRDIAPPSAQDRRLWLTTDARMRERIAEVRLSFSHRKYLNARSKKDMESVVGYTLLAFATWLAVIEDRAAAKTNFETYKAEKAAKGRSPAERARAERRAERRASTNI